MKNKKYACAIMPSVKSVKSLVEDLQTIIEDSRSAVAVSVNREMTVMYWKIGFRINVEILKSRRAAYGEQIVSQVATQLQSLFGARGFDKRNLHRMMQFASFFTDEKMVSQLASHLSWSHFVEVLPLKNQIEREFYLTLAMSHQWGRNRLRKEIDGMLFERTAISQKPHVVIAHALTDLRQNEILSPDLVFKDPYFLDFTGLTDIFSEKNLEDKLVANLEHFILELGSGFCFVARQKRIIVDGEDFYLDLLFYHRKLKRLIAVELKLGRFKAQYKGQMELYLRWLEENETEKGENPPLGLILCTEGSMEQIKLLQLDKTGIHVAKYLVELPPRKLLLKQIKKSLKTCGDDRGE